MTPERENELMLARILGISEGEAVQRLSRKVAITSGDGEARIFAQEVVELLGRTLTVTRAGKPTSK